VIILRRAPGHAHFDFGQTVRLALPTSTGGREAGPETNDFDFDVHDSEQRQNQLNKSSKKKYVAPAVRQDYEPCVLPSGLSLRLVLHSSWGDPYYIGLDKIEVLYASDKNESSSSSSSSLAPLSLREDQVAAVPASLRCLSGMEKDVRLPANLVATNKGSGSRGSGSRAARGGWLAPLAASLAYTTCTTPSGEKNGGGNGSGSGVTLTESGENEVYVLLDRPAAVAGLRIWNYSKDPKRGAREVSVFLDDRLIMRTGLAAAAATAAVAAPSAQQNQPQKGQSPPAGHQCLLFSNDAAAVAVERSAVRYCGSSEQDVLCIDEGRVTTSGARALFEAPNPSAAGIWGAHREDFLAKRPTTASSAATAATWKATASATTSSAATAMTKGAAPSSSSSSSSTSSSAEAAAAKASSAAPLPNNGTSSSANRGSNRGAAGGKACSAVFLGGAALPVGRCASSFSQASRRVCDRLRCSRCNAAVVRFPGQAWAPDADYMWLREHYPSVEKLSGKMRAAPAAAAYACQCTSTTVGSGWKQVTPTVKKELRWFCSGH
jgi:hypothetical protein